MSRALSELVWTLIAVLAVLVGLRLVTPWLLLLVPMLFGLLVLAWIGRALRPAPRPAWRPVGGHRG